jgi:hypothetical protein
MYEEWFEPIITVLLCCCNVGVVVTLAFLLSWSVCFEEHYRHTEGTQFKCSKKQASMVCPCIKWNNDREIDYLEKKLARVGEKVNVLHSDAGWADGMYARTSHGIPIKPYFSHFLEEEVNRYAAHRAHELLESALVDAKAARDASVPGEPEVQSTNVMYNNPTARASMLTVINQI